MLRLVTVHAATLPSRLRDYQRGHKKNLRGGGREKSVMREMLWSGGMATALLNSQQLWHLCKRPTRGHLRWLLRKGESIFFREGREVAASRLLMLPHRSQLFKVGEPEEMEERWLLLQRTEFSFQHPHQVAHNQLWPQLQGILHSCPHEDTHINNYKYSSFNEDTKVGGKHEAGVRWSRTK